MRVVSCRFSLVLKLLGPLALGIIAVLTFRYHSHAATGAAVTLLPESTATGRAIDHERDNGGDVCVRRRSIGVDSRSVFMRGNLRSEIA